MKYKDRINTVRFIFSFLLLALIPMYLIFDQPDLSTTIVVFIILASIIFVAGLSWKIILGIFVVAVPSAIIFLSVILKEGQTLINDYQRRRVLSFFYPEKFVDDAYQQTNSVIAIGSGGLVGKGFNNDMINSLKNGFCIEMTSAITCCLVVSVETNTITANTAEKIRYHFGIFFWPRIPIKQNQLTRQWMDGKRLSAASTEYR